MLILSECQPKGIQKILHLTLCNGSQSKQTNKKRQYTKTLHKVIFVL